MFEVDSAWSFLQTLGLQAIGRLKFNPSLKGNKTELNRKFY